MAADCEVLIVGAGPVGLLLASLLGRDGIDTVVVEKRGRRSRSSRAIGITPPSLEILQEIGLLERFLAEGLPVREVYVHAGHRLLGGTRTEVLPGRFPFILSQPQTETERFLEEALPRRPSVRLRRGWEGVALAESGPRVQLTARQVQTRETTRLEARFVCACDGSGSAVLEMLGLRRRTRSYPVAFTMADYGDTTPLAMAAHLYFTPRGSVESFPLPGGMRRWIVQTPPGDVRPAEDAARSFAVIEQEVERRTGNVLRPADRVWSSWFRPEHSEASRFAQGDVVFCGDAAHTMPPIGGQGMNTGFGDARLLARVLHLILRYGGDAPQLLALYSRYRRRAFQAAALRSALFMRLGTIHVPVLASLRNLLFRLLARPPFLSPVAEHFAMLNIPYARLDSVVRREPSLLTEGQANEAARG